MRKAAGISALLLLIMVVTACIDNKFLGTFNIQNIARWTGMYGILTIGQVFVIITGGIDLSIGSVVGLVGTLLPYFLRTLGMPVWVALPLVMAISVVIGLTHGFLITKMHLQPFVVTLCGLFIYRGIARYVSGDTTQGFGSELPGLRYLATGSPFALPVPGIGSLNVPMPFLLLMVIGIAAAVLLNMTVFGRYLLALGRNEQAARFSGINTGRVVMGAYVISSMLAAFGGLLFALDLNSVQPSGHGNFYELYAIAGAVLGGCSLRGGEGSILGAIVGTAVVRVLYNAINILGIATQLEFAVIGTVILAGALADELFTRYADARLSAKSRSSPTISGEAAVEGGRAAIG